MREVSFREAIRDGLAEELERDATVFVMGEDVEPGGVFNVTPGLVEQFGRDRVIDTPISELAFTAAAFGAAVKGMRPVVEIMFGDFLGLVIDTLVNQASKYWYLSGEQACVPLVVRSAIGAGARFGACHSQTPTGWFLGEPGLKLVGASNPADAKGLTKAAVRDDNPVVVFEHKLLYGRKGMVPDGEEALVPIGKAAIVREGRDVTIAAAMAAVEWAAQAADELAGEGIEAEVIDLRSLRPLDEETIAASAAKTGRLVVVEEGPPTGGYASDVVALAVELAGPIRAKRVSMPDIPIPFSAPLEDWARPSAATVAVAARELAAA
jgi:pyruvate/2-oxoglutarate/acetoin dehydrogenase E1 component